MKGRSRKTKLVCAPRQSVSRGYLLFFSSLTAPICFRGDSCSFFLFARPLPIYFWWIATTFFSLGPQPLAQMNCWVAIFGLLINMPQFNTKCLLCTTCKGCSLFFTLGRWLRACRYNQAVGPQLVNHA